MKSEEYRQGVLRTESGRFDADNVGSRLALSVFNLFIEASKAVDAVKRAVYYGKPLNTEKLKEAINGARACVNEDILFSEPVRLDGFREDDPPLSPRIIHAILGLCTESGELLESAVQCLESCMPFDYMNFLEELGDVAWYEALAIETAKTEDPEASVEDDNAAEPHGSPREWTHEAIWEKNLAKLRKRYPEKFTTSCAFNRDTDAEKQAMMEEKKAA